MYLQTKLTALDNHLLSDRSSRSLPRRGMPWLHTSDFNHSEHWNGSRQRSFNEALGRVQIVYALCHGNMRGLNENRLRCHVATHYLLFLKRKYRSTDIRIGSLPSSQHGSLFMRRREGSWGSAAQTGSPKDGMREEETAKERRMMECMCAETCWSMLTACDCEQQHSGGVCASVCESVLYGCVRLSLSECVSPLHSFGHEVGSWELHSLVIASC